jgi:LAS superfamily LD-carboxypeptidase LdcB
MTSDVSAANLGEAESPFAETSWTASETAVTLPASWPEYGSPGSGENESPFAPEGWAAEPPAVAHETGSALSSSRLEWPGKSAEQLAFMRAVYDKHVENSRKAGATFTADLPEQDLDVIVGGQRARKDAAAQARSMLGKATTALGAAGLAGKVQIGVLSAYRPASQQFLIWQGKGRRGGFPHYYQQMVAKGRLHAGDYGPAAVEAMAHEIAQYVAAPGYSNHQDGLAIDFGTGAAGQQLGLIGTRSWFHRWLVDNAAKFDFHPYVKEAWHWTYRPPAQPAHAVRSGPAGRELAVQRVPLLASHHGPGPDLILRWNVPAVPDSIDVVVHLHGFWYSGMKLDRDIKPVSGLDLTPAGSATGAGRTRPTITVLPKGHDTGVRQKGGKFNVFTFPALVTHTGLDDLVRFSLDRFAATLGGRPPRVDRLILTAHSGGGAALLGILKHPDIARRVHQVHVFDALYQSPRYLADWAAERIRTDRAAAGGADYMTARGGALRVFYHGNGSTKRFSDELRTSLSGTLAGSGLDRWYRVESSTLDHFRIPRAYGWRVLADAAADVPDASGGPATGHEVEPEIYGAAELAEWDIAEPESEAGPQAESERQGDFEWQGDFANEWEDESEELFELEEFARHTLYADESEVDTMVPGEEAARSRPAVLTTARLRRAWRAYECAEQRMVRLRLFGKWNTPVNPETVDAWRALEQALTGAGYHPHRAWVFNCRNIGGQQTRSLHAYGLAIDIDHAQPACNVNRATPDGRPVRFSTAATKEERCRDVRAGTADTSFTPQQVAAVEAIKTVDGHQVFAWGGRWRTTKDTMHFQINVEPAELARGLTQPAPAPEVSAETNDLEAC